MAKKITHSQGNILNLRSEEVQEILANPPKWIIRWGITLVFVFTCTIILLSITIKYPDFITAKVIVTTEQPMEKVQAQYSGQLDEIFINNRDTVSKNQKLAIIKNTADFEDVYYLKSVMDSIPFSSKNFSFPISQTTTLVLGDIEVAYINFEKSYVDYFLLKDLEPHNNEIKGNNQSLIEIKKRLVDQIEQKQLLEKEFELKQTDFNRYARLYDKGVISQQEYESKELDFLQIQKNIGVMSITVSQMREAISSANQALNETYISKQEDNIRFLNNVAQSYNILKKAILDWEHNFVLTSSIQGVVSFHEFWGINQNVKAGDVVFSILPTKTNNLVGKLTVPSQNAGKITNGQKVLVKLDNYPYQQYGMLVGKVKSISISTNAQENYVVYISLPNGTRTSYNQNLGFDQELLGNAEIITEDLSVAERLFYKLKDIFKY